MIFRHHMQVGILKIGFLEVALKRCTETYSAFFTLLSCPAYNAGERGGFFMATISLCMIVKNEEAVLARCLDSVKDAVDEIIIVDTGSSDRTKEIAALFTEQVYDLVWEDDFAKARNFAFSKAIMDYQMWLDADDVLEKESAKKLHSLKKTLAADVVMLPYHVAFDSSGNPTFSYYRERLLRRDRGFLWEGAVHETITPSGNIIYEEIPVLHKKLHVNDPDRNLRIFEKQLAAGKSFSPRERYYYARELFYHERYAEAAKSFTTFLSDSSGWIEDKVGACIQLAGCYRRLGKPDAAMQALLQSFLFDRPRAEICCELGSILLEQKRFEEAVFWYETAAGVPFSVGENGFSQPDCHDYIPFIQLCVCYDRLGNTRLAAAYNEKAGRIKPKSPSVLANQMYFRERLKER